MAISSVLSFVNGVCSTVSNGFMTFLTLNYFVGQAIATFLTSCACQLKEILLSIGLGIYILFEDLSVFIIETVESIFHGFDLASQAIEGALSTIGCALASLKSGFYNIGTNLRELSSATIDSVTNTAVSFQAFFRLVGSTLLLLLNLIPRTLYMIYITAVHSVLSLSSFVRQSCKYSLRIVTAAPLESFLGLLACVAIGYSLYRLGRRVILTCNLSWGRVAEWTIRTVCISYIQVCHILLAVARAVARSILFTLTHLHVPRFHHAGDVLEAEDDDEDELPLNEPEAENEPVNPRQRNYKMLLRKRTERKNKKGPSTSRRNKGSPDMEELLFEQVEREREDKLCVVCQDKEKCIMLLPCRHLCICQDCQGPLIRPANGLPTCPICRRDIRQTIKVYL